VCDVRSRTVYGGFRLGQTDFIETESPGKNGRDLFTERLIENYVKKKNEKINLRVVP